jgi:hypothetical protein
LIDLSKFAGKDVLVQLKFELGLSFAGGGRPVPLMVKAVDGKLEVCPDPRDTDSNQMSTGYACGRVVETPNGVLVRLDDPINQGCSMEVAISPDMIAAVTIVGEKKSIVLVS